MVGKRLPFGRQLVLAIVALVFIFLLLFSPLGIWIWQMSREIEDESELRERLTSTNHLQRLEAWAMNALGDVIQVDRIDLPEDIRSIGVSWASVVDRDEDIPPHLWIEFGGGFHHHGLLIGPPGFTPRKNSRERINQWSDQVWYREDAP